MKLLTYSAMASARLRANKRQYLSLVIGIFLAIFLVTTIFLAAQGFLLAQLEATNREVGRLDAFLLDQTGFTDQQLLDSGLYTELGRVSVTAALEGTDVYLGYYDETAVSHMNRTLLEGRLPEATGEITAEQGSLLILDLERDWHVGDTLELSLTPIDGTSETRSFTLVGILVDQAEKLELSGVQFGNEFIDQFPALLVSPEEPAFQTGRTVVHRTLTRPMGKLFGSAIGEFQDHFYDTGSYNGQFRSISAAGIINYSQFAVNTDTGFITVLVLGCMLALALLASCCIGIAGAMEGALARRREEIGLLRVVGATKRQIRRIFGRESLILALAVSPFSIVVGILAVWLISLWIPEQMILKLNPLLIIPIAILSMAVILFAGYWPLRRFSSQMPMSVIRDTQILRRIKNRKSKKIFKVSNLISGRMLRLYPGRQVGSCILTALMLFCAICAVVCMSFGMELGGGDNYAFSVTMTENGMMNNFVSSLPNQPLSEQSVAQLRKLPQVEKVVVDRDVVVQILVDQKYDYLKHDNPFLYTEEEYMSRQQIAGEENLAFVELMYQGWEAGVKEYNAVREYLNIDMEMAQMEINTVVLDEATLTKLYGKLIDGKIDIEAINAGKEVIVSAPSLWRGVSPQGYPYSRRAAEKLTDQETLIVENDCFRAGMELPVVQLWCESKAHSIKESLDIAQRLYSTVRVGAVVSEYTDASWFYSVPTILTTEQGLQNMGLYANGYDEYKIYLNADVDLQTEEMLVRKINAIASRSGQYYFRNELKSYRENMATGTQLVAVFSVISILFAAVSISMIVSSITRRIQSDGKRIGMLRAVGADQKTILGCYTGQMSASILVGWVITVLALLLVLASGIIQGLELYAGIGMVVMSAMALGSWLICRGVLSLRIREIVSRSIIENIREL